MLIIREPLLLSPLRTAINVAYLSGETACVNKMLEQLNFSSTQTQQIQSQAHALVAGVRTKRLSQGGVDAFLQQYDLSSEEGIALMCIAEAMLRIPDAETANKLIRDKLGTANWKAHLGTSESLFVNSATWALMLTGKIIADHQEQQQHLKKVLKNLLQRMSEPVIRTAVEQAMKILGKQFVMGDTIESALVRARESEARGYAYSYDMLGEAARTQEDAERYYRSYASTIEQVGAAAAGKGYINSPGVSVKLSALHPRYSEAQRERVLAELVPKVLQLAQLAKKYDIGFTIDAEETTRLEISLDVIEKVFADPSLHGWQGFGLAIQAYQKRTWYLIDWLMDLARRQQRRLMVRLVKGAYWDSEIKLAQIEGRDTYPVFTRKANTDVSYLACAKKLLAATDTIYPQFATHNAHTLAAILAMLPDSGRERKDFEFQCLHGMGQTLYDQIVGTGNLNVLCRIYAPVGTYKDLLPYLVRRLLENGANTSFVNNVIDENLPIDNIIADPIAKTRALTDKAHPHIPLPKDLYGATRKNSRGVDLTDRDSLNRLSTEISNYMTKPLETIPHASEAELEHALLTAQQAFPAWNALSLEQRAVYLQRAADLLEEHRLALIALLIREAGKTWADAIGEVREAVDYCRYYAQQGRQLPAGVEGRGVAVCISPWNFPLAIFLGQVTGALMAGNTVLAKPAEQTPLVADYALKLLHQAGIPHAAVQLIVGRGSVIGKYLLSRDEVQAVLFTGSTETAQTINRTLAARGGAGVPLIAETGGQNAMIVDSSALPEQIVDDVIASAFGSAGQRCSALRVLFVQEDIANNVVTMLRGAMSELRVGEPSLLATDVGPVIDEKAKQGLEEHATKMNQLGKLIYQVPVPSALTGSFFAPCAYEISHLGLLTQEVFGPVLHVIRYAAKDLNKVLQQIEATGYGLTLGIHSRIETTIRDINERLPVGNTYVNRNMIGAVVGVQPFGGEGLSGTGPKAGGPHYLLRLCKPVEQPWLNEIIPHQLDKLAIKNLNEWQTQLQNASLAAPAWQLVPAAQRIAMVQQILATLATQQPSGARHPLEFCRELVMRAEQTMTAPQVLPGPTGESNQLSLHPRGVVACLSADDANLFISLSQWIAALLAGNVVIARLNPQNLPWFESLLKIMARAGMPQHVLQGVVCDLYTTGKELAKAPQVNAVMLNADAETAAIFYRELAARAGLLVPLILRHEYENYLWRLSVERTLTVNITAKGGNTTLLSLKE